MRGVSTFELVYGGVALIGHWDGIRGSVLVQS